MLEAQPEILGAHTVNKHANQIFTFLLILISMTLPLQNIVKKNPLNGDYWWDFWKKWTDWNLQNESHSYKWYNNQQIQGICWDQIIVQMCLELGRNKGHSLCSFSA